MKESTVLPFKVYHNNKSSNTAEDESQLSFSPHDIAIFIKMLRQISNLSMSNIVELQVVQHELLIKTKNYSEYVGDGDIESGVCLELLSSMTIPEYELNDQFHDDFNQMINALIPDDK